MHLPHLLRQCTVLVQWSLASDQHCCLRLPPCSTCTCCCCALGRWSPAFDVHY